MQPRNKRTRWKAFYLNWVICNLGFGCVGPGRPRRIPIFERLDRLGSLTATVDAVKLPLRQLVLQSLPGSSLIRRLPFTGQTDLRVDAGDAAIRLSALTHARGLLRPLQGRLARPFFGQRQRQGEKPEEAE